MTLRQFLDYSIIRDLAGGGMAHLYVARDAGQNRVIVRVLREQYVRDRRIHKNFLYSAEILARLQHPNIVRLIKCGRDGRTPYMVLEYIESRNLRDLILHRDDLLAHNVLSLMRQMAPALAYIHNSGYLHLDFKPENLLVQEDGKVVLVDFDLVMVRKPKPVRIRQEPAGTPSYIAPEIFTQRLVDERADIYSFGVTCYEMLCYHKPFEAVTIEQARAAQIDPKIAPTALRHYNPAVPARLEAIVLKALAKRPEDRYPSMSLVVKDLEAML